MEKFPTGEFSGVETDMLKKLIIKENKEYIGQEVAEEAIADINEQQEGGKENVQEK